MADVTAKINRYTEPHATNGDFETYEIALPAGTHWQMQSLGADGVIFTLYKPTDAFLSSNGLVSVGEVARRQEARDAEPQEVAK